MEDLEVDWNDRDSEFDDDDSEESSLDLRLNEQQFSDLLVAPADWTIETLYSQIGKQIDLNPEFQRRNVWSARAKSSFIESLMLGIPIPQILLSTKPQSKSTFIVLDGKQRLLALKEFLDGSLPNGRKFRLKNLRVLKQFENKSWDEIKQDADSRAKLLNETQRTTVLRGWSDEAVLYEIFFRLNSGSVKLSPMELRMSLYPGDFLKFIMRWTEKIGPIHKVLRKTSPDPRMNDVELAIRFLAFSDHDIPYRGDLKDFLDTACQKYNLAFSDERFYFEVENRLQAMNRGINSGLIIFNDRNFCRKYSRTRNGEAKYESRFNRAIFDIMSYTLSDNSFREWSDLHPDAVRSIFERLCLEDTDFSRSIETTTKSESATFCRFSTWITACNQISGSNIEIPKIGG